MIGTGEGDGCLNTANKARTFLFDHMVLVMSTSHQVEWQRNERIGLAKLLAAMTGDTVRAEIYAKYLNLNITRLRIINYIKRLKQIIMRSISSIIFLLVFNYSFGQLNIQYPVIPPTPDAAALGKFIETPVGNCNGVPNISIPLYEVVEGDIRLPITLNYHAGGIKVNEEASMVGLGWSLSYGGEIILNRRGYNGRLAEYDPEEPMPISAAGFDQARYTFLQSCDYFAEDSARYNYFLWAGGGANLIFEADNNYRSGERDMYLYSFGEYAGKFVFARKHTSEGLKIESETLGRQKIEFVKKDRLPNIYGDAYGGSFNLEATAPNGFKYFFEELEYSKTLTTNCQDGQFGFGKVTGVSKGISSYKLTRIQSPNQLRSIGIEYKRLTGSPSIHSPNFSYSLYRRELFGATLDLPESGGSFSITETETKYVDRIVFSKGVVKFHYSPRIDIKNGYKLDSLTVEDRGGNVVRRIAFNLGIQGNELYFGNPHGGPFLGRPHNANAEEPNFLLSIDQNNKRLKLNNVQIGDQLYQFDYSNDPFPGKTSFGMDFWGFYNGRSGNVTLLPDVVDLRQYHYVPEMFESFQGANRKPDPAYMQMGMLASMAHPTGGKTEYTYEPHAFSNLNTIREKVTERASDYNQDNAAYRAFRPFTIDQSQQLRGTFTLRGYIPPYSYPLDEAEIYVAIERKIGNNYQVVEGAVWDLHSYYNYYHWSGGDSKDGFGPDYHQPSHYYTVSNSFDITLYAGEYRLVAHYPDDRGSDLRNGASISLDHYTNQTKLREFMGGGLRLSEVMDIWDSDTIVRSMKYDNGVNMQVPVFTREEHRYYNYGTCPGETSLTGNSYYFPPSNITLKIDAPTGHDLFSNSVTSYSNSVNGSIVGYKKVTVEYSGGKNGKVEYDYDVRTVPLNQSTAIQGTPLLNIIGNGNLEKELYLAYDKTSNNYNPVKEVTYNYGPVEDRHIVWNFIPTVQVATNRVEGQGGPGCDGVIIRDNGMDICRPIEVDMPRLSNSYGLHVYPIKMGRKLIESKTERTFVDNDTIVSQVYYAYNPDGFVRSESVINSEGKPKYTHTAYVGDIKDAKGGSVIKLMNEANMINVPIEVFNRSGENVTRARYYQYGYRESFGGLFHLKEVYELETGQVLNDFVPATENSGDRDALYPQDPIIEYEYDNFNNNVIMVKRQDGTRECYYWHMGYPLVKAEDCPSYLELHGAVELAIGSRSLDLGLCEEPSNEWKTFTVTLRSSLIDSNITTYTYKPLVGISSVTDMNGDLMFYQYDEQGRLEIIKDNEDNILKTYEYNYHNR